MSVLPGQVREVIPELADARFPRAAAMLDLAATAAVLRAAADELDELAGAAHSYEPGTLRRMARGIVLGALAFGEGTAGD